MTVNIEITKNLEGTPTEVKIKTRYGTATVEFDGENMKIHGRLTAEARDLLKLIYPFPLRNVDFFKDAEIVQADLYHTNNVTVLYTVPARKKLYIVAWFASAARVGAAGVTPYNTFYVENPFNNQSLQLIQNRWTFSATDVVCANGAMSNLPPIPSAFTVRSYANAAVAVSCGFWGVLKDA